MQAPARIRPHPSPVIERPSTHTWGQSPSGVTLASPSKPTIPSTGRGCRRPPWPPRSSGAHHPDQPAIEGQGEGSLAGLDAGMEGGKGIDQHQSRCPPWLEAIEKRSRPCSPPGLPGQGRSRTSGAHGDLGPHAGMTGGGDAESPRRGFRVQEMAQHAILHQGQALGGGAFAIEGWWPRCCRGAGRCRGWRGRERPAIPRDSRRLRLTPSSTARALNMPLNAPIRSRKASGLNTQV
jgi:hypothetical protein